MQTALQSTRLLLKLGWLVPIAWLVGDGLRGSVGVVPPIYVFLVFGLLLIPLYPVAGRITTRLPADWKAQIESVVFGLVSLAILIAAELVLDVKLTVPAIALNWVLLLVVIVLVGRLLDQVVEYDYVLADFRLGVLSLALLVAIAYKSDTHANLSAGVFAGVVAYGLLGVFGLAFARRYAIEELNYDERSGGIQADWLLSVLLLIGAIGIVGILVAQLFEFDIVGTIGRIVQPLWSLAVDGIVAVLNGILSFMAWIVGLLGFHFKLPKLHSPPPGKPNTPKFQHHPRHGPHAPAWLTAIFKAVGIIILAGGVLAILAAVFRIAGGARRRVVRGDRRVSAWSWKKMGGWFLGRGRKGLTDLLQEYKPRLPRRHPMRTVRDVYRSFLGYGGSHARVRIKSETGLEYSHDLSGRWPASQDGMNRLNDLYLAERYGSRPATPETVGRAKADLQAVEAGAGQAESG